MTAHIADELSELRRTVAELEQKLNASLSERDEALAQQSATADILKAISSANDLQTILTSLTESAILLCGAAGGVIFRREGDVYRYAASTMNVPRAYMEHEQRAAIRADRGTLIGRVALEKGVVYIPDAWTDPDYKEKDEARIAKARAMLGVPLMLRGELIGAFGLSREEPGPFTQRQVELVTTFADQAVIAIENARLFNETQEALARQTATSDVLRVIGSSPGELQPVFDVILENATRICAAKCGILYRCSGDALRTVATHGAPSSFIEERQRNPIVRPNPETTLGRALSTKQPVQIADILAEVKDLEGRAANLPKLAGARTVLAVPMVKGNELLGAILIYRQEVRPFTDKEIELVKNFAAQAVIAIENTRLLNELRDSLQRQTATADVLKVISRSAFDLGTVMNTLARSALDLCGSKTAALFFREGDMLVARGIAAHEIMDEQFVRSNPASLNDESHMGRAVLTGTIANIGDFENNPHTKLRKFQQLMGFKSFLAVPLMREGRGIGVFALTRDELGPFSERQVELVQGFADQAVIAIENARLFNETKEALARQTATSDVLKVIASSPSNLQPVFDAIAERSRALIGAHSTVVVRYIDGMIHLAAFTPVSPEADAAIQAMFGVPRPPMAGDPQTERVLRGEIAFITDAETELQGNVMLEAARARGWRSRLLVPLKDDTGVIGWISIARKEAGGFAEKDVELLQTFADQAVIAIKNAELFEEVQAKTRDLEEALIYQTGSSNILKVIASSPTDVGPALRAIAESACEICNAYDAVVFLKQDSDLVFAAHHGSIPINVPRWPINRQWVTGRALTDKATQHIHDLHGPEGDGFPEGRELARHQGQRTVLSVPLLREGEAIGVISIRRVEVQPFNDKQIELLKSFADQAVIAISNVRLFDEVQTKTRDIEEALRYQTGSANILSVIASSPTEVGPVLKAIVKSACELCEANDAVVALKDGDDLLFHEQHGSIAVVWTRRPINRHWTAGRAVADCKPIHVHDLSAEGKEFPEGQEIAIRDHVRTILSVPLLRENEPLGVIMLRRVEIQPFSDKQVALLQTFADQAVIAIGNVRLFEQVQQRTKELSKSLDDLRTAQDRLIQTEKLASLGQLTAGIAHEIKNPLNFVNNFSALSVELTDELNDLLRQAEFAEKIRQEVAELTKLLKSNLEKIVQHGKRADSIVKNMLLHSRQGSAERRTADINALVDESLNLAYHGARAEKQGFNITLERDFDPTVGIADIYPQEVTRVLLNLISNGFYAATQRGGASNGFEPKLKAVTRDLGDKVEIRIRDNGMGIPPDIREKIFNPFFTTKPAGEGTGLGLSMSHDIVVKQHGGTIEVETEPGSFTEFIITLPRVLP